jgi:hypothetical protein
MLTILADSSSLKLADRLGDILITRKKNPKSRPPRKDDAQAWRHEKNAEPVLLFRCPLPSKKDRDRWVTREERDLLIRDGSKNHPFTTARGHIFLLHPVTGQYAWFKRAPHTAREMVQYDGSSWVPCTRKSGVRQERTFENSHACTEPEDLESRFPALKGGGD